MQAQEVIESWPGVLVSCGLGDPCSRGVVAGVLTAGVMYAMKYPRKAFRPDGSMRPAKQLSIAPDATSWHFILTPLIAGGVVALVT